MPTVFNKRHGDSDASALRELAEGNRSVARRGGKMSQTEPGEGYGNPQRLPTYSEAPTAQTIRGNGRGNPK